MGYALRPSRLYEKSKQECGPPDRRMHQAFPIEVSWKLVRLFPPSSGTHLRSSAIQRRPEKPCPTLPAYAHTGSRDRSSSPGDDFIHPLFGLPLGPQQTATWAFLAQIQQAMRILQLSSLPYLPKSRSSVMRVFSWDFHQERTKISPSLGRTCSPSSAVS